MHASHSQNETLALFDFDGTLYPHDSFTGFIFYTLSKRHIIRRGIPILPWILAYYAKLYPAHKMRPKLYQAMFKGITVKDISIKRQHYVLKLLQNLHPELLKQLLQHQAQHHRVVLVSATVDLYLKDVAEQLGIDVICSKVEVKSGILTGRYTTEDCSNTHKKQRIIQQFSLEQLQTIYAYGNSHEDLEMLSLSHQPYMVGQTKDLPRISTE
ncbi:phosphoserine phosphatase [Acinetobacter sp. NCu2D-2]|uniref:HAD-IB family hydrolase n=1 Tax=Acinetobacter sp. NCu2D-2 TaxID=1608473 RepID=UPI0007CDA602|nr:HAD-IB family hydrolase [Acinetobacter sp. NCu2D-2]ANF81583.1 phosphoserine phosphatase [Acinetobacter sp. NCu2D-2]